MSKAPKGAKQPQDHQKKAPIDRLRAEADTIPGVSETEGRRITITGKLGAVTVSTLPMLDWDGDVPRMLATGDYLGAFCGMVSDDDAVRLRAVRPTLGALMTAIYTDDEETGEASPGESQAS